VIGWLDRLLSAIPHRCEPHRYYTALGWTYRCGKWYCGRIAHTEIGLLGGGNADEFLDIRRRNWGS
jgi:hypothetical protein